jgi:AraC-like DNA-binding protein
MLATHAREELNRRDWPAHIRVDPLKAPRRRVAVRGPRRKALAYWPDEACEASRYPFLGCVIKGRAMLHLADYALFCQVGDFVFVPPGVARSTRSHAMPDAENSCDIFWLTLDSTQQLSVWICHSERQLHESGPQYGACQIESVPLARQFTGLSEELLNTNNPDITYHLLSSVLLLLSREIEQDRSFLPRHHLADHHQPAAKNQHDPIEQARTYIDEHLGQSLTAGQVARHICISASLFHRNFRLQTGTTFHHYLTVRRLEKSSVLLRETDAPINLVGQHVGLRYSQLRRLYTEHYGCTPGEFRREWAHRNSSPSKAHSDMRRQK